MRGKFTIIGVGLLCLLLSQGAKADLYNDGGVHDILTGEYGFITVDSPPPPEQAFTTVNFGGTGTAALRADLLEAFWHGQVNVNRGFVDTLSADDYSQVTVNGGIIMQLPVHGSSQVTVNGGGIDYLVADENGSHVTVNGGNHHSIYAASQLTMNGGMVGWLRVGGWSGEASVNGGLVDNLSADDDSRVTVNGGTFMNFSAIDHGLITVYGSDFAVRRGFDLVFSGYGDLTSSYDGCYLSGMLASGEGFQVGLGISEVGRISLVPVPLPGAVLLGAIGLSIAGWRLRRRTS